MLKNLIYIFYFLLIASIFIGPAISLSVFYPLRIITPLFFILVVVLFLISKPKFKFSFLKILFWTFIFTFFIMTLLSSIVGYISLSIVPEINDIINFFMIFILLITFLVVYDLDFKRFFQIISKTLLLMYFVFIVISLIEVFTGFHFASSIFYNTSLNIPTGFFTNPNDLACIFTLMFLFIFTHYKLKFNLLVLIITLLHVAIVFYTSSRISLFIIIIYFILFKTKNIISFSLLILVLFFVFKSKIPANISQNMSVLKNGFYIGKEDKSKDIRKNLYINGLLSIKNSFGLGYGVNASSHYYKSLYGDRGISNIINPHSYQLELLINSGVIVLFFYLILNFYIFFMLVKKKEFERAFHIIFFNISLFSSSSSLYLWPIYLFLFIYFAWADNRVLLIENE